MKRRLLFLFAVAGAFLLSFEIYGEQKTKSGGGRQTGPDADIDSPADLPGRKWKEALVRTKQALKSKDLAASAAGLAYYATLSFFPALLGLASCYAIFADPQGLLQAINGLRHIVPPAVFDLLHDQLAPLSQQSRSGLGWAAVISIGALLWTTSGGIQNLVKATNKAYEVDESRSFIKLRLVSLVLSLVLLVVGSSILALLLADVGALRQFGAPEVLVTIFPSLRWLLLVGLMSLILSVVYRYAPDRREPYWQWVSWGAAAASVVWLAATALFFLYVQNFSDYNKSYGTLAGIIVLMIWFNVTSLIILLGAQVNKKLEEVTPAGAKVSA